jgi:hypothetical protein
MAGFGNYEDYTELLVSDNFSHELLRTLTSITLRLSSPPAGVAAFMICMLKGPLDVCKLVSVSKI